MIENLRVPLMVLSALSISSAAAAQENEGTTLSSAAESISIGGRIQTQFNTTSVDGVAPSELFIRRARVEIGVTINDYVSGTLQPEFGGGSATIRDAYMEVSFSPGLHLFAGQQYRPFGLLEQTSSKRILPIERGLRIRGLDAADEYALLSDLDYTNRDIGIQLRGSPTGAPLGLSYGVGVLRGPQHGRVGDQESFQVAGRVTISPVEPLRLGAGWSTIDFAGPEPVDPELRRGHALEVDLEYGAFAPGWHLLAELSRGDLDPFDDATFWGAHGWLGYRTEELDGLSVFLEPVLRVSHSDTSEDGLGGHPAGGTLFTPGLTIYFSPINRIMFNYDWWMGEAGTMDARSFKTMFQLGF